MAKTPKETARIIFGNKEKKQFPDPEGLEREKPSSAIEGSTQPIGFETRLRAKFSEQANEIGMETRHREQMKTKGMRQTFAKRASVRPKHLQHPAPVQGGHYKQTPQMEKPHYEEYEKMENKTFTQFVTEAKRGRPRKLKPGEQADTEHLQDQLSKLTHANHVMVHFKNGEKHEIPRAHANKALIHLSGLKPIHRADHVEHMHSSKENFYHTLASKSIPSKKKTITLAGPKLRKEEVELDEENTLRVNTKKAADALSRAHELGSKHPDYAKHMAAHEKFANKARALSKAGKIKMKEDVEQLDELGNTKRGRRALAGYIKKAGGTSMDSVGGLMYQAANADPTAKDNKRVDLFKTAGKRAKGIERAASRLAKEEHEDDGWYAHKEMHGKDAVSKEDWKKGVRPGKSLKKEEADRPKQNTKTDIDVRKHTRLAADALGRAHSLGRGHKDYDKHMAEYARHRKMALGEEVEQIDELTGKNKKLFGKDPLLAVARRAINRMKLPPNDGSKLSPEEIESNKKNSKVSRMAFDKMEEEVESDEKKKTAHHKLLQKFRHRIDEVKAIKGTHATKQHSAKVINPGKVGYAGKGTKPKIQSLRREDYAPLESGEKQTHVDQKTANAKSRVQGGDKPKKPKMELNKEAWELYDSLSDAHKTVFENMDSAERDRLVDKYISGKR